MADSSVAVTAGSGTSIDTRTEGTNGNHRQVVVVGDPSTNAGVAPVDATNGLSVTLTTALPSGTATVGKVRMVTATGDEVTDDTMKVSDGGGALTVDGTVSVTGVATAANQTTVIGHLDGVEGLLTTIDADTGTLAGAVSGTEMQVDIVSAPTLTVNAHAVTNAGTFAVQESGAALTALQLIDDSVYTDGSGTVTKGVAIMGQDGTNPQAIKTDTSGELQVDVLTMPTTTVQATNLDIRDIDAASDDITIHGDVGIVDQLDLSSSNPLTVAIVDGSGDQITSFGGGTQYTEDAAAAANPVGTALNLIRDDNLSGSLTTADGDNVAARGNNKGELYVKHTDAIPVTDNSSSLTVDNAGLTELAAAINSNKVDVNIVSSDIATGGTSAADDADFTAGTTTGTPAMGVYESTPTSVTDGDMGIVGITSGRRLKTSTTIDTALPAGTNNIGDVDVLSSALPTGASTLAEQQSQTTHLATIAGDTTDIETSVELIDDSVYVDDADWTNDTSKHLLVGGVYQSTPHTVTDGDVTPFLTDTNGRLAVAVGNTVTVTATNLDVQSGGADLATSAQADAIKTAVETIDNAISGSEMQVDIVGSLPAGTAAIGKLAANDGVDIGDVTLNNATIAVTQSGTWDEVGINDSGNSITVDGTITANLSATDNAVLDSIDTSTQGILADTANIETSVQLIDDAVVADDATFTPATTKVIMAGFEADESSTDSVDEGDGGAARMTLDRKQIVNVQPHTSGGLSTFMASGSDGSTALTNSAQAIKASAGQVYGYYIYNPNSSAQFVHFYNTAAASVTVGTTNPLFTLTIPATAAANLMGASGIEFTNAGFSISATATAGGNGAPSTALDAVVWYK